MAKRFTNRVHNDVDGKPLRIEWDKEDGVPESGTEVIDVRTEHIFRLILKLAKMDNMQDSINGMHLHEALRDASTRGYIDIDIPLYVWLKAKAEAVVVKLWRINAVAIMDFLIDGYEKGDADAS